MSKYFIRSQLVRDAGLFLLQKVALFRRSRGSTAILVNSLPKAGTHLVTATLGGHKDLIHSRIHIELEEVSTTNEWPATLHFEPDLQRLDRRLHQIRPGFFGSSHLPWRHELSEHLLSKNIRVIYIVRNSEARLRSQVHYITELKRLSHHKQLTEYADFEARLSALRAGMPRIDPAHPGLAPAGLIEEEFAGWETDSSENILIVHFEDLVGVRGGGDDSRRIEAIRDILKHCELPHSMNDAEELHSVTLNRKSATYRAGTI